MADAMEQALGIVERLEAGDLDGAVAVWSPRDPHMLRAYFAANWGATLDEACGAGRRVTEVWQLHRDRDLAAAAAAVLAAGADALSEADGHHVLADTVGHPFCLREDASLDAPTIGSVVFDCDDPAPMAAFWGGLLSMDELVEHGPDRVVIRGEDPVSPMLGFQRVDDHRRPTWPGDDYPEQLHVDLGSTTAPQRNVAPRISARRSCRHPTAACRSTPIPPATRSASAARVSSRRSSTVGYESSSPRSSPTRL